MEKLKKLSFTSIREKLDTIKKNGHRQQYTAVKIEKDQRLIKIMIQVTILKNEKHACVGFRTKGHAGMSEAGQDIVCAAASVLIINTVNAIDRYTSDETSLVSDDEEGVIEFELPNSPSERAALLLDAMILGL